MAKVVIELVDQPNGSVDVSCRADSNGEATLATLFAHYLGAHFDEIAAEALKTLGQVKSEDAPPVVN